MAHTRRMLNELILMSLKCFWSARFPKGKMMIKRIANYGILSCCDSSAQSEYYGISVIRPYVIEPKLTSDVSSRRRTPGAGGCTQARKQNHFSRKLERIALLTLSDC